MADVAVAAQGLTKSYRGRRAIDGVSFEVRRGEICGLLGPNGSGKTTTMRVLVGLSRPDRGSARLLGEPSRLAAEVLARTGVAIDGPAFVPHLSGGGNLRLFWKAGGGRWPPPALEESLDLAGLGRDVEAKVRTYSMGMRQRLMLAQALMGAPEVLILDEPANGLDPGEVRTLREHLGRLADRGAAVLISSHLLTEVEALATHTVVMNKGVVLAAGELRQLLGADGYEFDVDQPARAERALRAVSGVQRVQTRGRRLSVTAPGQTAQELNQALVRSGVGVKACEPCAAWRRHSSIWWGAMMLGVELATQLRRPRSLIVFGVLAGLPILAAVTRGGGRGGRRHSPPLTSPRPA